MSPQGPRSPAPCSRAPALGQHSQPSRFGAKATARSPPHSLPLPLQAQLLAVVESELRRRDSALTFHEEN